MSGHMPIIDVQLLDEPVELAPFDSLPQSGGAECAFLGRTRMEAHPQLGKLVRLSYEAYRPMAETVLRTLAQEASERFDCLMIRIRHALGEVSPGQASVAVQVASSHRAAAFDACRFLIDRLKVEAPIWKREEWADGSTWNAGSVVAAKDQT